MFCVIMGEPVRVKRNSYWCTRFDTTLETRRWQWVGGGADAGLLEYLNVTVLLLLLSLFLSPLRSSHHYVTITGMFMLPLSASHDATRSPLVLCLEGGDLRLRLLEVSRNILSSALKFLVCLFKDRDLCCSSCCALAATIHTIVIEYGA